MRMSIRRKGRELALMVLYALDGVPTFERREALARFWALFDEDRVWEVFLEAEPPVEHPLEPPPLWSLFDSLSLEVSPRQTPPPFEQARLTTEFAQVRIDGVLDHLSILDEEIGRASRGWRIQRMAQIDRNILRIGAYEILHCSDIPGPVIINEALELSKRFSSRESRSFINGVLDRILRTRNEGPAVTTRPSRRN